MRKGIVTILMIVFFGGLWYAAHSWSKQLEVSKVVIRGLNLVDESEILKLVELSEGALFENIDPGKIREQIIRHLNIKAVSVNRDFPATIRITVVEREPVALLVGSRMVLIDNDNVILPVRESSALKNLAIVSGSFTIPQTGDTLQHSGVEKAIRIFRATKQVDEVIHYLFSEIQILNNGELMAYTADRGVPVMLGKNISARNLIAFREFWLHEVVPAGADQVESVDLRFEGQIVTRWQTVR